MAWLTSAAAVTSGLYAGVYAAFSIAVMPGLARSSDEAFVETFRDINEAILNPAFMALFLGAPLLTAAVAAKEQTPVVITAAGLQVLAFAITIAKNVPLNEQLVSTNAPAQAAREAFEGPWVGWHTVRTIAVTGAFALLVAANAE